MKYGIMTCMGKTLRRFDMDIHEDPIVYGDMEGWRNVDPRLYGVDCVPLFGRASIKAHTSGAAVHVHSGCIE